MGLGNGLKLTWVGHATWILDTPGGKRVLIDPWVTGNPVVTDELRDPGQHDVMLLTHGHSDHIGDAVALAKKHSPGAVLAIIELGDYLEAQGVENVSATTRAAPSRPPAFASRWWTANHSSSARPGRTAASSTLGEPAGYVDHARGRSPRSTSPATPACSATWR